MTHPSLLMDHHAYKIGDPVLFHADGDGELEEGRVVHVFIPLGWDIEHYVIEIEHMMGSNFYVRSGHILEMRQAKGTMEYDSWSPHEPG